MDLFQTVKKAWLPTLAFVCGAFFIFVLQRSLAPVNIEPYNPTRREKNENYRFINPLLFCNITENKEFMEFTPLKDGIQHFITKQKDTGHVSHVSAYFRDLEPGLWFGIDENEKYSPASLLKVPTLVAFFKLAETQPEILSQKIQYQGDFDETAVQNFPPKIKLEKGQWYTVSELLAHMIIHSDNNARRLLHGLLDARPLFDVYTDLGLTLPTTSDDVEFMSVKTYSYAFRVLYNASYINRSLSEKALELLSFTDFPDGIRAGIPGNILVANKFGERVLPNPEQPVLNMNELHDCGIIYYPDHPYFLCVMTRGNDFDALKETIRGISHIVYQETKNMYAPGVDLGHEN